MSNLLLGEPLPLNLLSRILNLFDELIDTLSYVVDKIMEDIFSLSIPVTTRITGRCHWFFFATTSYKFVYPKVDVRNHRRLVSKQGINAHLDCCGEKLKEVHQVDNLG